jgi:formylglycine-generating enzyme required for sulfatase activity
MKTRLHFLFIMLALLTGIHQADAQGTRFFRISGPAATAVTAFRPDGTMVWSNAQPGATYTIQTVSSLPGGTNWVDYVKIPVTHGVNTNQLIDFNPPSGMALIPAGVFTMGDNLDGESDAVPTNVTVSAFCMDVSLVSYSQWQSVYNWATNQGYGFDNAGSGKAADHPVQTVDWYDTVKWCNARSQQAGLAPVYYTDAGLTQVYTNGDTDAVYPNWTASGYRLPTEAEWEKAARGGLSGQRFPWGNVISESLANYYGDTNYSYDLGPKHYNAAFATGGYPYTSPVGYFAANGYELYDMAGNVFEWCGDWYGTPYAGGSDPRGPASGSLRVLRGGDWSSLADWERCANRINFNPNFAVSLIGFRCVRGL